MRKPSRSPNPRRWSLLALLMLQAAMVHFNRGSMAVVGSELFTKTGWLSETEMGGVYTAYLVVYTLLMLPGGLLIDLWGPRRAMLAMGIGSCLLVPLTGLAGLIPGLSLLLSLMLIRGCLGGVTPPMHPGAARAVSLWFPQPEQGLANSLVTGTAVLGIVVTPILFGPLMDRFGWRLAFVIAGGLTALVTLAWGVLSRESPSLTASDSSPVTSLAKTEASPAPTDARRLLLNSGLVWLALAYACYSYFQYLFFYWAENYFLKVLQFDTDAARWATSKTLFSMAIGMVLGGTLIDWLRRVWPGTAGRIAVPICGLVASAVFVVAAVGVTDPQLAVACFCLSMGALGMCEAPFWVTGVDYGRRWGGTTGALLNTVGNAGGLLAPLFQPIIAAQLGWIWGLRLAGLVCLLGAACWLGVNVEEPASPAPHAPDQHPD